MKVLLTIYIYALVKLSQNVLNSFLGNPFSLFSPKLRINHNFLTSHLLCKHLKINLYKV